MSTKVTAETAIMPVFGHTGQVQLSERLGYHG